MSQEIQALQAIEQLQAEIAEEHACALQELDEAEAAMGSMRAKHQTKARPTSSGFPVKTMPKFLPPTPKVLPAKARPSSVSAAAASSAPAAPPTKRPRVVLVSREARSSQPPVTATFATATAAPGPADEC